MDFDATEAWSRVAVPVLLLKGGDDDHMLLRCPYGRGVPPPQFADGFLETLLTWITEQAPRGATGAS